MTNEEKNNLISYLKKYEKIDTQSNNMIILMFIFSLTLFAFIGTNQKIWAILNLITLIILIISIFIIAHNQNQIAKNIFLLLKDYNVITINEEIIEVYNEQDLINAAKNNQTIDLSTNCEKSVSEAIDARNTSVINLLKNNPDVKKVTKIKQTYTVNELILDYQKDINKICDENIPKTIIKYETTKPIGKAELKK